MARRSIETRQKALALFEAEKAATAAWWKQMLGEPLRAAGEDIYYVDQSTFDTIQEALRAAIGGNTQCSKIWIHGRRLAVLT